MKKQFVLSLIFMIGFVLAMSSGANQQDVGAASFPDVVEPPTDQIIIRFADGASLDNLLAAEANGRLPQLSETAGVDLYYYRPMSGDAHVLKLADALPMAELELITNQLSKETNVLYAEPDAIMTIMETAVPALFAPDLTPNDPLFNDQWHYEYIPGVSEGINLPSAWNITTGSSDTVVAVIDTGVLYAHSDLNSRLLPGYDFISDIWTANDGNGRDLDASDPGNWVTAGQCSFDPEPRNSSWHGTHVAGTIGATTNNGLGVAGVNWHARILPVRVLGRCGSTISDIVDGMRWAAGLWVPNVPTNSNPANVLNLSLGGGGSCGPTYQNAINAIVSAGSVVVVAAGNDNINAINVRPANCNSVITVAATNRIGNRAFFRVVNPIKASNYGAVVEISAPGGETYQTASNGVLSTLDSGTTTPNNDSAYAYYQGTSMATPHVSGVVSLLLAQEPDLTPVEVLERLQGTARPFPNGSSCNSGICGAGIVDAYQALLGPTTRYAGAFHNNTNNVDGSVLFDIHVTATRVNGWINFTDGPDVAGAYCGAGPFWGTRSGNNIHFTFISHDPDPGCHIADNWQFIVDAIISGDQIVGDYSAVDPNGNNLQTGNFFAKQTIRRTGRFINNYWTIDGAVYMDLATWGNMVAGYINFTEDSSDPFPLCGANSFTGSQNGNNISFSFLSSDPDPGCEDVDDKRFDLTAVLSGNNISNGTYYVPFYGQGGTFWADGTVPDSSPPNGGINAPAEGATLAPGTSIVTAQVADNEGGVGISHVTFRVYYDDSWHEVSTDPSYPYTAQWQSPANMLSQQIRFSVDVTDKAGNQNANAGGEVTVNFNGITKLYLPVVLRP